MAAKKPVAVKQAGDTWYVCTDRCYHAGKLWQKHDRAPESRILSKGRDGRDFIPPQFVKEA